MEASGQLHAPNTLLRKKAGADCIGGCLGAPGPGWEFVKKEMIVV